MTTLALTGLVGLVCGLLAALAPQVVALLPTLVPAPASGTTPGPDCGSPSPGSSQGRSAGADDDAPDTSLAALVGGPSGVDVLTADDEERAPLDLRPLLVAGGLGAGLGAVVGAGAGLLLLLGLPADLLRAVGSGALGLVGAALLLRPRGRLLARASSRPTRAAPGRGGPLRQGLALSGLAIAGSGTVLAASLPVGAAGGEFGRSATGPLALALGTAIGAALPVLAVAQEHRRERLLRGVAGVRAVAAIVLIALAAALVLDGAASERRQVREEARQLAALAASPETRGALTPFETDENRGLSRCVPGAAELADCGPAPALRDTGRWFNTLGGAPLNLRGLRGRVVLLRFFASECINCRRDQPYVEKWSTAYADAGLAVVGVHSPEFSFESDPGHLAAALERSGTTYPVVEDEDLATWSAYRNRAWPSKFLIDRDGTVRAITLGEGGYRRTELLIRRLLAEGGADPRLPALVTPGPDRLATRGRTPELYLADNREGYVGNPRYLAAGEADYTYPSGAQPRDTYGLAGRWTASAEHLTAVTDSRLRLAFRGRTVNQVLGGQGVVTISRVGAPERVARQIRVDGPPRLRRLIDADRVLDGTVEITYGPGVEAYNVTFE